MIENREAAPLLTEVLMGLSRRQKSIPPKYLYDKQGSEIFERICELEEYYPTRTEKKILQTHGREMASFMGDEALIIEPGSGSGEKVRFLLNHMKHPAGFVPIEISPEILYRMTDELHEEYPHLKILPVEADFTRELEFPLNTGLEFSNKVVFFPGSTIGNFSPEEALDLLKNFGKLAGHGGAILIGADLKKDEGRLVRAYDDSEGVTAAFNLNLLDRLNREVAASFDLNHFYHRALYNAELGRVEMHLVSKIDQMVRVNQTVFRFQEGETIHTESSYKYTIEEFSELCLKAKLILRKTWQDPEKLFCVYYLEKE